MRSSSLPIVAAAAPVSPQATAEHPAERGFVDPSHGVADRPSPSLLRPEPPSSPPLNSREQAALLSLCRAVIPGGAVLPAAGPELVARLEGLLRELGAPFALGYIADRYCCPLILP